MKKIQISLLVMVGCIIMGIVDAVIRPGYAVKSIIKIISFLLIPVLYEFFNKECNIKMIGWFGLPVVLISLLGLFAGGMIFNRCDEKNETIYLSWLIHMFANFATNTIGFILFAG